MLLGDRGGAPHGQKAATAGRAVAKNQLAKVPSHFSGSARGCQGAAKLLQSPRTAPVEAGNGAGKMGYFMRVEIL
jgi:hypothetical protein